MEIPQYIAPVLFILNGLGGRLNRHKLFKILYFADKDHISKYGRSLTSDRYIAMANGPVPSRIYDYVRILDGKFWLPVSEDLHKELASYIRVDGPIWITALQKTDLDFLSKSAIASLEKSIKDNKDKSFGDLSSLSHDGAWQAAEKNSEMSLIEIAKVAGANEEMIKYIQETM